MGESAKLIILCGYKMTVACRCNLNITYNQINKCVHLNKDIYIFPTFDGGIQTIDYVIKYESGLHFSVYYIQITRLHKKKTYIKLNILKNAHLITTLDYS